MKVEECDSGSVCEPNPETWCDLIVGRFYRGLISGEIYMCANIKKGKALVGFETLSIIYVTKEELYREAPSMSIIPKSKSFKLTVE